MVLFNIRRMKEFMQLALKLAKQNVEEGGWPFSAVIVKNGEILASATNSVHVSNDPSDHAEIAAIRKAAQVLNSSDLSSCTMYVVGLPCPMCATCLLLSKISKVFYAVDVDAKDAALSKLPPTQGLYDIVSSGFGNSKIDYLKMPDLEQEGVKVFKIWNDR